MRMRILATLLSLSLPFLWLACAPSIPEGVGGLEAGDFELISINGFETADNAVDMNDYAWSMAYFKPDNAQTGHVYVGTGNDMIGLMYQGVTAMIGMGELGDVSARPPEIRRYRPDLGDTHWERVFDYREVETNPNFETIGFRYLKTYRAQADGINYLYAGTMGRVAAIWRTSTGEPGSWEQVWSSETEGSVRMMAEHKGLLYLALANEIPGTEQIGKIYATDGQDIWPIIEDSFGNPENTGVMSLISFNNWLYAGTANKTTGYEIFKLEGPDGQTTPVKILDHGGPSSVNQSAITVCTYKNKLYVGNMIDPMANIFSGFKAADIIRIDENDQWETVVGPGSISGFNSGFQHWPNTYIWAMTVHEDWLYASSYDQVSAFFNMLDNTDKLILALFNRQAKDANIFEILATAGADLYKTQDGTTWYPVTLTGFGDVGNYGLRTLVSTGDELYAGTTNPFDGLEIWVGRSDNPSESE